MTLPSRQFAYVQFLYITQMESVAPVLKKWVSIQTLRTCSRSSLTYTPGRPKCYTELRNLSPFDVAHGGLISVDKPFVGVLGFRDGVSDGRVLGSVLADVHSGKDGKDEADRGRPETDPYENH